MSDQHDIPVDIAAETVDSAEAYDETDVPAALERSTDDGKGGAVVPKADFVSYEADEKVSAYQPEDDD